MVGVAQELPLITKSKLGFIIHIDGAKVDVGIKTSEETWRYRLVIGVSTRRCVLVQEAL